MVYRFNCMALFHSQMRHHMIKYLVHNIVSMLGFKPAASPTRVKYSTDSALVTGGKLPKNCVNVITPGRQQ